MSSEKVKIKVGDNVDTGARPHAWDKYGKVESINEKNQTAVVYFEAQNATETYGLRQLSKVA